MNLDNAPLRPVRPMTTPKPVEHVFWHGSIGGGRWADHVAAAEAGGFTGLSTNPSTILNELEAGRSADGIVRLARDAGLSVHHFDIVTNWAVPSSPDDRPTSLARFDIPLDRCFEIIDALGLRTMNAIPAFHLSTMTTPQLVDCFGALCVRAASHGVWVDLEFMPFWGIPDLRTAWGIVEGANQANSGILVDTWHFCRGDPDWGLLAAIPDEKIVSVQLADGSASQVGPDLYADNKANRCFVGEGELPVGRVLAILAAKGCLQRVGPEIFSDQIATMDVAQAGQHAACGSMLAITEAGLAVQARQ